MALTKEELMKPRYKVIADYPDSKVAVGMICYKYYTEWIFPNGLVSDISMETYPHLFRKLAWYEDRKEDELPEYVKWKSKYKDEWIIEKRDGQSFIHEAWGKDELLDYLPATIEEYNNYKNSHK